jgi:hypothetical protein
METVTKLEKLISGWYAGMPHLPENGRKWLAKNVWWIALVGVIAGAMGLLMFITLTFFAGVFLTAYAGVAGAALVGAGAIAAFFSVILSLVALVLTAMAIAPLKAGKKRGWTLLFITALLNVLSIGITLLCTFNLFNAIWNLLFAALGAYFLFEIRSYFSGAVVASKSAAKADEKQA